MAWFLLHCSHHPAVSGSILEIHMNKLAALLVAACLISPAFAEDAKKPAPKKEEVKKALAQEPKKEVKKEGKKIEKAVEPKKEEVKPAAEPKKPATKKEEVKK